VNWKIFYKACGIDELAHKKHTHDSEVELIHILSGEGNFLVGNSLYPICPGTVLVIDSGCLHYSSPVSNVPYIRNKLIFQKSKLICLLELCSINYEQMNHTSILLSKTESEKLNLIFREISESSENGAATVSGICRVFELCLASGKSVKKSNSAVDDALKFIHSNLSAELNVGVIADCVHLSSCRLCHVFKEKTGFSLMEYIKLQRIVSAQNLLVSTDRLVSDIALLCGYENFSYFSRIFKSVCGMSPTEYRKSKQNN